MPKKQRERQVRFLQRTRNGWIISDDDGTVLYGPTWTATLLDEWCQGRHVRLEKMERGDGEVEGVKSGERLLGPDDREDDLEAGRSAGETVSAAEEVEQEEEVT